MGHDLLDQALVQQLLQSLPGQRPPQLEPLTHDGRGDEFVGWHLLQQLLVGGLVEQHGVVQLVPGLAFGPLLFLGFAAAASFLLLGRFGRRL